VENLILKVVEGEALQTRMKEQGSLNTSFTFGSELFALQESSPDRINQKNTFLVV